MESFKLSVEAIMPIFILMLLGYLIKRWRLADKQCFDGMNKLAFRVFLPVLLFYNIYKTETADVFNPKVIAFGIIGVLCVFIAGYFLVFALSKDNAKRGVMLQGFFRTNFAIVGIPLVGYICGEGSGGVTAVTVAIMIPVFNVLAVTALERFKDGNEKLQVMNLLKGVITNPLIIGCLVGILFFVLDIKLPPLLERPVKDVASIATPLSIIVLGSVFELTDTKAYAKEISIVVGIRLVLVPLIMLPIAVWLGFTGEALVCTMVLFSAPVAVSSFAMAREMGGDERLAVQLIAISSALCLLTLFIWIFALSSLGLI